MASGRQNNSSSLAQTIRQFYLRPTPLLIPSLTENGRFQIQFVNQPELTYDVLATTNLTPPITWELLGSPTNMGNRIYQFIDTLPTNGHRRFYRVRLP
jgi:hypothetical protein